MGYNECIPDWHIECGDTDIPCYKDSFSCNPSCDALKRMCPKPSTPPPYTPDSFRAPFFFVIIPVTITLAVIIIGAFMIVVLRRKRFRTQQRNQQSIIQNRDPHASFVIGPPSYDLSVQGYINPVMVIPSAPPSYKEACIKNDTDPVTLQLHPMMQVSQQMYSAPPARESQNSEPPSYDELAHASI